jgi:hypothetical protein
MEQTFDQLVREFKALVAFQLSGKGETMSPIEKQEIRRQIGKLVDAVATLVVGIPCKGMNRLSMMETVVMMSSVRQDIFDKLDNVGIKYSQYASEGAIAVQLTDKESGVCIYRSVTDTWNDTEMRNLMATVVMERASLH